jgi:hypothetical protein
MTEESESQPRMSRRRFGAVLGGAGVLVAGGITTLVLLGSSDDRGEVVRSFDVQHDPSVYVTMTNGTEFVVEVKDTETRDVLERFERVTARTLLSIDSAHVRISKTA